MPTMRAPLSACTTPTTALQVNVSQIEVDQSALTGESLPVTIYAGESAKMGSTVVRGEVEATVEVRRVDGCGPAYTSSNLYPLFATC